MRFKIQYVLLRKRVRDHLAFPGVLGAGTGAEDGGADGDEGVVEVGFEGSVSVGVEDVEGSGTVDGDVVGGDADEGACRWWRGSSKCVGGGVSR